MLISALIIEKINVYKRFFTGITLWAVPRIQNFNFSLYNEPMSTDNGFQVRFRKIIMTYRL